MTWQFDDEDDAAALRVVQWGSSSDDALDPDGDSGVGPRRASEVRLVHRAMAGVRSSGREVAVSGAKHGRKGSRVEREIVARHTDIGVAAERYPLSGASRFRGRDHDIDVYAFGAGRPPLHAEVKARGNGGGFTMLEKWIKDHDILFLRRDGADPLVVLPFDVYERLLTGDKEATNGQESHASAKSRGKAKPAEGPRA